MLQATPTSSSYPTPMPMPGGIRALLLDDSNFDRARIRRLSEKTRMPIQLDEVDSLEQMELAVARENYDLILIDYRLPVGDGMQALNHVLQTDLNKDAGKIMITGDGARQTAVEALRGGCHDFLTKEEMDVEALRRAMMTALTAAHQQRHLMLQVEQQREIIRQGVVAAIQDSEVQGNVINIVRQHLSGLPGQGVLGRSAEDPDLDALIATFQGDDDFIFH